ncbi:MAG: hypothetical protein KDD90_10145, partial [Sphingomonadaceae bacterium]|nr:hypothetical protein [Sphingomonadaceae bacterium]
MRGFNDGGNPSLGVFRIGTQIAFPLFVGGKEWLPPGKIENDVASRLCTRSWLRELRCTPAAANAFLQRLDTDLEAAESTSRTGQCSVNNVKTAVVAIAC